MEELERIFKAPMIEAYGMTEASHQMASNPLPPAGRKPGSVGKGTNVDIGIMDSNGRMLPHGERGEVVIKGKNVVAGYENNPDANAKAFIDGWFRTGDEGYIDEDGYLFLTGRLKEVINRGGEKISPREVDEVLLGLPEIAEAVAFALPHEKLGEDVAVAWPGLAFQHLAIDALDLGRAVAALDSEPGVSRSAELTPALPEALLEALGPPGIDAVLDLARCKEKDGIRSG